MLFSSWLRNCESLSTRSARRTQASSRPRARFRPRTEAMEDRCLLSGYQQTNLVGYQSGIAQLQRLQLERLGHGFHAGRVFRCVQHVHHRAGHVLQQLRPRAPADDHHPGVGVAGHRSGARDRARRPPHRRRLQSDESTL